MAAVVFMGGLIVVGTTVLLFMVAHRLTHPRAPVNVAATPSAIQSTAPATITLAEPEGTTIRQIVPVPGGVAALLSGGGPDRVVVWTPTTGQATTALRLAH